MMTAAKTMTLNLDVPIDGLPRLEYPPRLVEVHEDSIALGVKPTWREHYRLGDYLRIGEQSPFCRLWQLTAADVEQREATIISRTARFRAAETTAAFLKELYDVENAQSLIDMFRSCGGIVINPGGLSQEDRDNEPTLIGKIHDDRNAIWFQRAEDTEHYDVALLLAYRAVVYPPSEEYPPGTHLVDPAYLATTQWWPLVETSAAMIRSWVTRLPDPLADRAWAALGPKASRS